MGSRQKVAVRGGGRGYPLKHRPGFGRLTTAPAARRGGAGRSRDAKHPMTPLPPPPARATIDPRSSGAAAAPRALDIGEPVRTVELPDDEPLPLPEPGPPRREEEREADPVPVRR